MRARVKHTQADRCCLHPPVKQVAGNHTHTCTHRRANTRTHAHTQRAGLPPGAPLYKSVSGELSNLRWDLPLPELPSYYGKSGARDDVADWTALKNFTAGLAGGGPVPR